ncbi:MAG: ATP-dependent helicase/nuclease subunit A [Bacteroidetes bacterium ADurb.Bin037]|nr:MAG: ATP-dependent helicase/nuclease subunit A [Bacteroidetes bacterium ADurb.Bin037]
MALKVYKASAGTGKTYRLTLMYLSLLLGSEKHYDPLAFGKILAVTFTNKATGEMKSRILDTLESLARGQSFPMAADLSKETGLCHDVLVSRARIVHKSLLHNYSWFSVSTLDAFFQRVLRSFVMEAGLGSGYLVDTDTEFLLERTARRIIAKIPFDISLRTWFTDLIHDKISRSDSWNAVRLLKHVGHQATRESFRAMGESFAKRLSDRDFLREFIKKNGCIIKDYQDRMALWGKQALEIIYGHGFSTTDFPNKQSSFARYFEKISDPDPNVGNYIPGTRVKEALEGVENVWFNKNSPKGLEKMQSLLMPLLHEILEYYGSHYQEYATAVSVRDQLFQMGLLADVIITMRQIQEENNTLDIGDSTYLLNQLVGDGNTPFIFERIGAFYESFLLDEFQDTSYLQWRNMYPLILNGLSQGADSLIVGDVKQSIYRWRNSDWRILGEQITNDRQLLKQGVDVFTLNTNYRSRKEIIDFVNMLIDRVLNSLSEEIGKKTAASTNLKDSERDYFENMLKHAYAGYRENIPEKEKDGQPGYVQVNTFASEKKEEAKEKVLPALKDLLISLLRRGYKPSDILVLVRSNEDARTISQYFFRYRAEYSEDKPSCPQVVSEEALYLASSPYVGLTIALLRMAHYPQDECNTQTVLRISSEFGKQDIIKDGDFFYRIKILPLPDAFEAIMQRMDWTGSIPAFPYLQELHDTLLQFVGRNSGGAYAFLKWWDERGKEKILATDPPPYAVRLMTIHKAKGLESPVVIVPFCGWPMDSRIGSHVIWTSTTREPFNLLDRLPVVFNDRLLNTYFAHDYFLEYTQRLLDSLNMLYVAVTRPREELYVFLPLTEKKSSGDIACHIAKALFSEDQEKDQVWSSGRQLPLVSSQQADESTGFKMEAYPSADFSDTLKLVYREDDFNYAPGDSPRQWGIILHKALSRIEGPGDIELVLQDLIMEGELSGNKETVMRFTLAIEKTLSDPAVSQWFDGSWTVRNEASILGPLGKLRPDRVMEKEGRTIVLDYKFGQPDPSHRRQMDKYVTVLRRMGYTGVEGHLLYIVP